MNSKQKGWICPRCQKVHAPLCMECNCAPIYFNNTEGTISLRLPQPVQEVKYVYTGEIRPPKHGEYFIGFDGEVSKCVIDFDYQKMPIVTPISTKTDGEEKAYSLCSAHRVKDPNCNVCYPDYKAMLFEERNRRQEKPCNGYRPGTVVDFNMENFNTCIQDNMKMQQEIELARKHNTSLKLELIEELKKREELENNKHYMAHYFCKDHYDNQEWCQEGCPVCDAVKLMKKLDIAVKVLKDFSYEEAPSWVDLDILRKVIFEKSNEAIKQIDELI